jgi:DNA-binding NarL/FixJ family response regulator
MTPSRLPIRIVVADDNEIFRDGFRIMLQKQSEIELVAEAENGKELLAIVAETDPDVVITDIKMPVMDGISATVELKQLFPGIGIIAFTMFDEEVQIVDMLEAGARGYLLKSASKREILEAIRNVYEGHLYYCNSTNARLARMIGQSRFNPYRKAPVIEFSARELEIIRFICQEKSNKDIAEQVFLSVRTIEGYREKIQDKIGARNAAGIVIYAIKNGIYKIGHIAE